MRLASAQSLRVLTASLMLLLGNLSCSLLLTKNENGSPANNQWSSNSGATPAEIAEEITKISAGEIPTENEVGKWNDDPRRAKATEQSVELPSKRGRMPSSSGKAEDYVVKRGDTLMKIAFEKYGDLYRWREIYESNRRKLLEFNRIVPGMKLTIEGVEYVVIEKNGQPYLIKSGDSLSKISNGVYGTSQYWQNLWQNNKQLIHDPNKIYSGFTLYYQPFNEVIKAQNRGPAENR